MSKINKKVVKSNKKPIKSNITHKLKFDKKLMYLIKFYQILKFLMIKEFQQKMKMRSKYMTINLI